MDIVNLQHSRAYYQPISVLLNIHINVKQKVMKFSHRPVNQRNSLFSSYMAISFHAHRNEIAFSIPVEGNKYVILVRKCSVCSRRQYPAYDSVQRPSPSVLKNIACISLHRCRLLGRNASNTLNESNTMSQNILIVWKFF